MNSAPLSSQSFSRYRFSKTESTKRALSFSLIAHLGLLAFLMIGIQWRSSTPAGVEVELWDSVPQVNTPAIPEIKTEAKEEAADIAIKKKKLEKEIPKKEPVKEIAKPKPAPPPEKPAVQKVEPPKAL